MAEDEQGAKSPNDPAGAARAGGQALTGQGQTPGAEPAIQSLPPIEQFQRVLLQDPALQERLARAQSHDAFLDAAVQLGNDHGYVFTKEQLQAHIATLEQQQSGAGGVTAPQADPIQYVSLSSEPPPTPAPPPPPPSPSFSAAAATVAGTPGAASTSTAAARAAFTAVASTTAAVARTAFTAVASRARAYAHPGPSPCSSPSTASGYSMQCGFNTQTCLCTL